MMEETIENKKNRKKKFVVFIIALLLEIVCQLCFYKGNHINFVTFMLLVALSPFVITAVFSWFFGRFATTTLVRGTIESFIGGIILEIIPYVGTYILLNQKTIDQITDSFSTITNENVIVSLEIQGAGNIIVNFLITFILCVLFTRIGFSRYQKKNKKENEVNVEG